MRKSKHIILSSLMIVLFLFVGFLKVSAASTPSLTLSAIAGNSVQVTVYGADPEAAVTLYYTSATSSTGYVSLGLTNSSGYLSSTINAGTYGIPGSAPVYAVVDGAQSSSSYWPVNSGSSGSLSLSQIVLNMGAGQSGSVTANNAVGALHISGDTNPAVAIGTIFGNTVVITANDNLGTVTITVCDANNDCQPINISVLSSPVSSFSLSSSVANLTVGQSQTITISGLGPFSISQNTNPSSVSVTVSGDNVIVTGLSAGGSTITVCQSDGECGTINSYSNPAGGSVSNTSVSSLITFNPSNVNLAPGQNQVVSLSGSNTGQYYVSNNSNPSVVKPNLNGNILTLNAIGVGSSDINVCSTNNQCNVLYVSVSSNVSSTLSIPLALSSFSISSGNQSNSFLVGSNSLTIGFNANQSIINPSVSVNNSTVSVNGSGSGPYTAVYTMTGSESMPLPVIISFSNSAGSSIKQYFWTGNFSSASLGASSSTVASNCPAGLVCMPTATPVPSQGIVNTSSTSYTFNNYLYEGMNKIGQSDPDVVALQQRLIKDGYLTSSATGYFGPATKAAVEEYQTANGLSPVGVVGPATRNLLNQGI